MKSSQTVFEVGKDLSLDEARFREGQDSLANYEAISNGSNGGGGDNIRRYLGTVGTTSALYGISRVI